MITAVPKHTSPPKGPYDEDEIRSGGRTGNEKKKKNAIAKQNVSMNVKNEIKELEKAIDVITFSRTSLKKAEEITKERFRRNLKQHFDDKKQEVGELGEKCEETWNLANQDRQE